jgi:hypothetical protein
MTVTSKREVARTLRTEADGLERHGFTDFFSHNFNCLQAQVLREDVCLGCLLRGYVPEEYRNEAFPCQHMDSNSYSRIASSPDLSKKVAERMRSLAEELEAAAKKEEAAV